MARKNVVSSHKMLDAITLTSNQSSESTKVVNLDRGSITVEWSGSDAVGTIEVQFKKQKKDASLPDLDWQNIDFGATIDITGASGTHDIIMNAFDFTDMRINFTFTSGTVGSLTATLTAKQIGG